MCLAFFSLAGCAAGPKYISKDFQPPAKVAILPFGNETNDVSGPEIVRKLLADLIPKRGYEPLDSETVDKVLREKFGITDGGQLGSATPRKLAEALKVDGLLYGNLLTFTDLPLGYVRKRTVSANLKLYDGKSGELIWEDQRSWTTPEVHFTSEDAKRAAALQAADRQIRRMAGTFLREETLIMLGRALQNLPLRASGPPARSP